MNAEELETLTVEQLEELIERAGTVLAARRHETVLTFTFPFEKTADPRKGTPYVARLIWNVAEKKIDREFFDMSKTYGRSAVTVSGEFNAAVGDVIEQRVGGSWKNDYRDWYVVTESGELKHVTNVSDSRGKLRVEKYLRRQITLSELTGQE